MTFQSSCPDDGSLLSPLDVPGGNTGFRSRLRNGARQILYSVALISFVALVLVVKSINSHSRLRGASVNAKSQLAFATYQLEEYEQLPIASVLSGDAVSSSPESLPLAVPGYTSQDQSLSKAGLTQLSSLNELHGELLETLMASEFSQLSSTPGTTTPSGDAKFLSIVENLKDREDLTDEFSALTGLLAQFSADVQLPTEIDEKFDSYISPANSPGSLQYDSSIVSNFKTSGDQQISMVSSNSSPGPKMIGEVEGSFSKNHIELQSMAEEESLLTVKGSEEEKVEVADTENTEVTDMLSQFANQEMEMDSNSFPKTWEKMQRIAAREAREAEQKMYKENQAKLKGFSSVDDYLRAKAEGTLNTKMKSTSPGNGVDNEYLDSIPPQDFGSFPLSSSSSTDGAAKDQVQQPPPPPLPAQPLPPAYPADAEFSSEQKTDLTEVNPPELEDIALERKIVRAAKHRASNDQQGVRSAENYPTLSANVDQHIPASAPVEPSIPIPEPPAQVDDMLLGADASKKSPEPGLDVSPIAVNDQQYGKSGSQDLPIHAHDDYQTNIAPVPGAPSAPVLPQQTPLQMSPAHSPNEMVNSVIDTIAASSSTQPNPSVENPIVPQSDTSQAQVTTLVPSWDLVLGLLKLVLQQKKA